MNTNALERHIIDTVKEWQMKIGYRSEEMKLYYPDVSLAGLLELAEGWTEASLKEALQEFSKETKERLGGVQISNVKIATVLRFRQRAARTFMRMSRTQHF